MLLVIFPGEETGKRLRTVHAAKSEILLLVFYLLLKYYVLPIQPCGTFHLHKISWD